MQVSFYIPEHHLPDKERRSAWLLGGAPSLLAGGKSASAQAWLFQTWVELRNKLDTQLSTRLPDEGIIVTLANFLPPRFRASPRQLVAAVVADFLPHPGAQIQIIQNAAHAKRLHGSYFIPHWPQPNLISRDPQRADRFETVAFFGDASNLSPDLLSSDFATALEKRCGARMEIREAARWHDYSDVDAVAAIRDFSTARQLHKPATKLYNAWLAGVPFIAGRDSAYAAEASEGTDYLVAKSLKETIQLLEELKKNPDKRRSIVAAGQKKAASRKRDAVSEIWKNLLKDELPRHWSRWQKFGSKKRQWFFFTQRIRFFLDCKFRS